MIDVKMNGWMDIWIDGWVIDVKINGCIFGLMDG